MASRVEKADKLTAAAKTCVSMIIARDFADRLASIQQNDQKHKRWEEVEALLATCRNQSRNQRRDGPL